MYLSVLPLSLGIASIAASPQWWTVRARASKRAIKPVYETRQLTLLIASISLSIGDCRASWRGVPVFRVAGGTFKLLQQPRVAIPSRARWPCLIRVSWEISQCRLQGDYRTDKSVHVYVLYSERWGMPADPHPARGRSVDR